MCECVCVCVNVCVCVRVCLCVCRAFVPQAQATMHLPAKIGESNLSAVWFSLGI